MPKPEPVTQREVTVYAKRQAAINRSAARNKILSTKFRENLDAGIPLPNDGPHEIVLASIGGRELSWEDEYRSLLVEGLVKKHGLRTAMLLASKHMEAIKENAPDKQTVEVLGVEYIGGYKLTVRANPTYRTTQRQVA
jgi:hypothetical protein